MTAILNLFAWIMGSLFIGDQFGWKAGVGVLLLTWFLKTEHVVRH